MTVHTPGPWSIQEDCATSIWSGGHYIAETYTDGEANARLIAVAPSMLADLRRDLVFAKNVVAFLRVSGDTKDVLYTSAQNRVEAIKAIIAKAEGAR